ncbi:MAG: bifunctional phosphoribosylaminoimidazolecarboxamide formyltransferase/IMP cyclohydrolase [Cyanobacteria bacterium P01_C01_bin.89]
MAPLALLSVSDKTGVVEFARQLVEKHNYEIVSSGGTAKALQDAGIPVTKVSDYTGSPEILGGRVKTLHPKIHGGILARRDLDSDASDLEANGMRPIDLVVVNLYPFEATIAQPDVTRPQAIEKIDIGGPTMVRAAAKNHAHVTILCQPDQYEGYLAELDTNGEASLSFRQAAARQAFWHTANYDCAIANYLTDNDATEETESLPASYATAGNLFQSLRYGENPHQTAAWYASGAANGWAAAEQLQGKALSYNNLVDLEAARQIISDFADPKNPPAVAILKHTNPCGVAVGAAVDSPLEDTYRKALAADSVSAFGGIVAVNRPIDADTAAAFTETFLECVVAPGCNDDAKEVLAKKKNLRILVLPDLTAGPSRTVKAIAGGFLMQDADSQPINSDDWKVVTDREPTADELTELAFAWRVVKNVKSNAIVVTGDRATLGIGAGQMNRVGSVKIALEQAGEKSHGAVLASDGFFPFDDSVRTAAGAGITAIIQPGGSMRDNESIKAANELGIAMVFTGMRHFLH